MEMVKRGNDGWGQGTCEGVRCKSFAPVLDVPLSEPQTYALRAAGDVRVDPNGKARA
jgi:hypothetical protein